MGLNIPKHILEKAEISGTELLLEVCVYLYDKDRLSFGQAKTLAELNHIAFQKELAKRNVYIKYDSNDLREDIRNLDSLIDKKAS